VAKGDTMVEHRLDTEGADPLMLAGVNDRNMHEVSRLFSVRVVLRGNHLVLTGELPGLAAPAGPLALGTRQRGTRPTAGIGK